MISLIIALTIIAVGIYGVVDYKRVQPQVDKFFAQFGAAKMPLMYVSGVLALGVLGASLYMALQWIQGEQVPTYGQLAREGLAGAERYSDQAGELIQTGVEDVEDWFTGRSTPKKVVPPQTQPVTGSDHMDFNAGINQYLWGPNKYPDLYNPQLIDGDGKCHPLVKGYCEGEGHKFKHHSYAQTCNQVTVTPAMRFNSSLHAWSVV